MSDNVIQTSFNSGEWSPSLYAQVNLKQYHSGAALLRNFFVDVRGGATTRPGTRYVATCKSNGIVRPIPFQASFIVSYLLEFGQGYVRFFNNGAPVLETGKAITAITQANPGVITSNAHGFANGDWVFISNVVGMTQLNGNTYIVAGVTANTYTLTDLFGNAVNTTTFGAYISGGTAQRVYTIVSPYQASEVFGIRYTQNVNQLVLSHPNYTTYILTLITATNWTLVPMVVGSTIVAPVGLAVTSTYGTAGTVNYAYVVTSVDSNGQESGPSAFGVLANTHDIRAEVGTITVTWTTVPAAASYNVYRAQPYYSSAVPAGSDFGFAGNVTGNVFYDSNILIDFSQGPPVNTNPFSGSGVQTITVTNTGLYSNTQFIPSVSFTGGGGSGAMAFATANATTITLANGGNSYLPGDFVNFPGGIQIRVLTVGGIGDIVTFQVTSQGSLNS